MLYLACVPYRGLSASSYGLSTTLLLCESNCLRYCCNRDAFLLSQESIGTYDTMKVPGSAVATAVTAALRWCDDVYPLLLGG